MPQHGLLQERPSPRWSRGSARADGRGGGSHGTRPRPHQASPRPSCVRVTTPFFPMCFRSPRSGPVSSSVSRDALLRRPGVSLPSSPHVDREAGGRSGLPRPGHSLPGPSDSTGLRAGPLRMGTGSPLATEPERIEGHLNPPAEGAKRL